MTTRWENFDKALTAILKLIALAIVLGVVLVLSFCSDEKVKETSIWTLGRLELVGIRPTKFSLLGVEFQAVALAATGIETANAKGLATDLQAFSEDKRLPEDVRDRLGEWAEQIGNYAQQLSDRDKKVVAAIRNASRPPAPDAKPVTGWVYLGRRSSSDTWAPRSDKIYLPEQDPLRELKVTKDVVLIEKDPATSAAQDVEAATDSGTIRLIRAGGSALKILAIQESPSIGSGTLKWARVEVNPSDLYEVKR